MNLKTNRKKLDDALKKLIIEKKQYRNQINAVKLTTKFKPVQSYLEFDDSTLKPGILIVESRYIENRIYSKIEIDCETDVEIVIILDRTALLQKISTTPKTSKEITLIFDENGYVTNTLQYKPDDDFFEEKIKYDNQLFSTEIDEENFSKILEFSDKNKVIGEVKYHLKGYLFDFKKNELKLVMTDGHVLILENFDIASEKEFSFVFLSDIIKLCKNASVKLTVFDIPKDKLYKEKDDIIYRVVIEVENMVYEFDTGKKFPNYSAVIPTTRNIKLVLDKKIFSDALNKFSGIETGKFGLTKGLCFHLNADFLQIDFEKFDIEKLYNFINVPGVWEFDVKKGKVFEDIRYCNKTRINSIGSCYQDTRKKVNIIPYTKTDTFVCDEYTIKLISDLEEVVDNDYENTHEFRYQSGCISMKIPVIEKEFNIYPNELFTENIPYRIFFNMTLMNQCLDNIAGELVEISNYFEIYTDTTKNPPTKEINPTSLEIKEYRGDKKLCLIMPLNI